MRLGLRLKTVRGRASTRTIVLAAACLAGGLAVLLAGAIIVLRPASLESTSTSSPGPTQRPGPSEVARGWPTTSENASGLYAWDGGSCARRDCNVGFMHNGYGSGDVDIHFAKLDGPFIPTDSMLPASVAGHYALYRRTGPLEEAWFVEIEDTVVQIRMVVEPGTSEADLAEGHAIIESIRSEPRQNALGFWLVFRLTTGAWDSG